MAKAASNGHYATTPGSKNVLLARNRLSAAIIFLAQKVIFAPKIIFLALRVFVAQKYPCCTK
eukprot:10835168-Karenia_brevis.AAC.1